MTWCAILGYRQQWQLRTDELIFDVEENDFFLLPKTPIEKTLGKRSSKAWKDLPSCSFIGCQVRGNDKNSNRWPLTFCIGGWLRTRFIQMKDFGKTDRRSRCKILARPVSQSTVQVTTENHGIRSFCSIIKGCQNCLCKKLCVDCRRKINIFILELLGIVRLVRSIRCVGMLAWSLVVVVADVSMTSTVRVAFSHNVYACGLDFGGWTVYWNYFTLFDSKYMHALL